MRYAWATALLATMSVAASAQANDAEGFSCPRDAGQQANVNVVGDFYLRRSLAIVEAARKSETAVLQALVSPDASFAIIQGDVGMGPQSKGAQAGIEFFQSLTPSGFRYFPSAPGPFPMDPCGRAVADLELNSANSNDVYLLTFEYRDGLLRQVSGGRSQPVVGSFD